MSKLTVVPPTVPDRKTAILERIKAVPKPDGILQCNRCGSRTSITETTGAILKNGKKQGGTVGVKDACANCYKKGIHSPMTPELKRVE